MAGTLTISTLNDSSGVLATQNGMTGIAKAWVNFVGSSGSINGSFNVSSVTRTATGRYTINFTTAMPNANYAILGTARGGDASDDSMEVIGVTNGTAPTTSAVSITASYGIFVDPLSVYVAILSS
jgi:hypothetical protein